MELIKIYHGGVISARELYQYLELNKAHWKRWYTKNITQNPYAIENEDWEGFAIMVNNNKTMDFAITLGFAKKLAMLTRSKKGEEIRDYFIKCEETLQVLKQENKRFEAFLKLETTKERLHQNILNLGGTQIHYIQIDTAGSKILFNGEVIHDEELGLLALKGRDFATELTNDILKEGKHLLNDVEEINKEQHRTIRQVIIDNTKRKPEDLPRGERIKKLGK